MNELDSPTPIYQGLLFQGSCPNDLPSTWAEFDVIVSLIPLGPLLRGTPPGKLHLIYPFDDAEIDGGDMWAFKHIASHVVWAIRKNKRVLVHCGAGLNRSGLICALALLQLTDWSSEQVIGHIQELRPMALCNPYFTNFIKQLRPEIFQCETCGHTPAFCYCDEESPIGYGDIK